MRKKASIFALVLSVPAVTFGATRIYDVDVYRDVNRWCPRYGDVTQTFVNTADSLLWAEFFVGAGNSGGQYGFEIRDASSSDLIYSGTEDVIGQNYTYVRCSNLQRQTPIVKGKTYKLVITHSNGDSINYHFSNQNPYRHGYLDTTNGFGQHNYDLDLCARIEGIVYNNPEMVGAWDEIPKHFVDPYWLNSVHGRSDPGNMGTLPIFLPDLQDLSPNAVTATRAPAHLPW